MDSNKLKSMAPLPDCQDGGGNATNYPSAEWIAAQFEALNAALFDIREMLCARRKDFFTVDEVAEQTGRSPYTVRRWIAEERLRAIRIEGTGPRGKLLIARSEFESLIAQGLGAHVSDRVVG